MAKDLRLKEQLQAAAHARSVLSQQGPSSSSPQPTQSLPSANTLMNLVAAMPSALDRTSLDEPVTVDSEVQVTYDDDDASLSQSASVAGMKVRPKQKKKKSETIF
eukprot:c8472_g1_i1.p2 GENE.c8472_g1_i1~~c8472_g1_i1.p2  ORF type:complete len:105 (+),score=28.72 c8472_g1_i1:191-505(+)